MVMMTLRKMMGMAIVAGLMAGSGTRLMFAGEPSEHSKQPTPNSKPRDVSHAYPGHGFNQDLEHTLSLYPDKVGTRIDDCRLCHVDGVQNNRRINNCDYCHMVYESQGYNGTLNSFGKDYNSQGRTKETLEKLKTADSDGDGFTNDQEIIALTLPGDNGSRPGQPECGKRLLKTEDLTTIPGHSQFMLMNASKHVDYYATYRGWTIDALLKSCGISKEGITGITVFSLDGYRKDISKQEIDLTFPEARFMTQASLGIPSSCPEIVTVPSEIPTDLQAGQPIKNPLRVMLANNRDGKALEKLARNENGKLDGEGNYRLILPERSPSPPDQSSKNPPNDCPFPYTHALHHNAGDCARGVVAIRIDPVPAGMNDVNWLPLAQELLDSQTVLVFGRGVGESR